MRPNTLLTTLLYALLFGLIIIAIWKGCEMQRNQEAQRRETEELKRTMTDNAFVDPDSSEYGSSYSPDADTPIIIRPGETPPANMPGIEDEEEINYTRNNTAQADRQPPTAKTSSAKPANTSTKTATPSGTTANSLESNPPVVRRDGRYHVLAGSFTKMEGARRQLEQVIKLGYPNAEVGKYNSGKYAVVIVKRTDDLQEARNIEAKLEAKGIDARVFTQQ